MMHRWIYAAAALSAALGIAALMASVPWRNAVSPGSGETSRGESLFDPEIVLMDVDMREMRKSEPISRVVSERASFRVLEGRLSAYGVTVHLPGRAGELVLRAPEAQWDMKGMRIFLPAGGTAETRGAWSAKVSLASVSLQDRVLTATGEVGLSGPGFAVAGENMVWRWPEGTVEVQKPRSQVLPARALGRKG